MTLTVKEIASIAHLARLDLDARDIEKYNEDLTHILSFAAQIESVNTAHIQPMAHPLNLSQRLRADEVTETNQRERFQALAPCAEKGLYLVPIVIE